MNWLFIRRFPKVALVFVVIVVSTGLFAFWWVARKSSLGALLKERAKAQREEVMRKAVTLPEKMGWLVLAGNDLYDVGSGELIFTNWLPAIPERLFYRADTNRLMAQTERGVFRYGLDGKVDAAMGGNVPLHFTYDGKVALYVKGGDIWIADTDWKEFALKSERQVTKTGGFSAPFFAPNVMLRSEKSLVVRSQNQLLRVNLLSGEVQPIKLPLGDISKRRSPDGRFLVGDEPQNIYAFDVEAADAYNFPTGRDRLVDYQWLGNERCAFIVGGKGVGLYNRATNAIEEVTALPFPCNKMAGPSPDGRYVLCAGRQGTVIIDTKSKMAEIFGTQAQHFAWVSEDTLIFCRDVPDTSVRGTWLKAVSAHHIYPCSWPTILSILRVRQEWLNPCGR